MKAGVMQSEYFLLVLTEGVLFRPYCVKEICWAIDDAKPVLLLAEEDERFHPFVFDEWSTAWQAGNSDFDWCLSALTKLEPDGELRAREMMTAVERLVRQAAPEILPYRRRNFEARAMLDELLQRAGFCATAAGVEPVLSRSDSAPMLVARADAGPVQLIFESAAGGAVATQLKALLAQQGLDIDLPGVLPKCYLVVLTAGALLDGATVASLEAALNSGLPLLAVHHNWPFNSPEQQAASDKIQALFALHEIVTFRERPYECAAVAAELARRFHAILVPAAVPSQLRAVVTL